MWVVEIIHRFDELVMAEEEKVGIESVPLALNRNSTRGPLLVRIFKFQERP